MNWRSIFVIISTKFQIESTFIKNAFNLRIFNVIRAFLVTIYYSSAFISASRSFICASRFTTLQLRSSKKNVGTCCTL